MQAPHMLLGILWQQFVTASPELVMKIYCAFGHLFGEELLEWVWKPSYVDISKLLVSSKTLKTNTKVEAFACLEFVLFDFTCLELIILYGIKNVFYIYIYLFFV
jgi:hypothetical protein